MSADLIAVKIIEKQVLANDYCVLKLVASDETQLPEFTAGAHISVKTPQGGMRNYSLANDPADRSHYLLGIKAERTGRGASTSMIDDTLVGDILQITLPENDFELVPADKYLFIAGGIGITPILSMCKQLRHQNKTNFHLIYCTQSSESTVFFDLVTDPSMAPYVTLHHDEGDFSRIYDFWSHLETPDNSHIYCCGPKPLMEDIQDMSGHWPAHQVHFEDFKPVEVIRENDTPFVVHLSKSDTRLEIPADQTILETLRNAGYDLKSSCESGTCGTCKTPYLSGNIDHRDLVLTEAEKAHSIMICVSRAKEGEISLDL
jgi:phthalate 4,5-dioxygenase reductase subunit